MKHILSMLLSSSAPSQFSVKVWIDHSGQVQSTPVLKKWEGAVFEKCQETCLHVQIIQRDDVVKFTDNLLRSSSSSLFSCSETPQEVMDFCVLPQRIPKMSFNGNTGMPPGSRPTKGHLPGKRNTFTNSQYKLQTL